jgi:L-lactate dehydrogenase complex protein LldG
VTAYWPASARTGRSIGLPDIHAVPFIRYDNQFEAFATLIRNLGGDAVQLQDGQSVADVVAARWPDAGRTVDLTVAQHEEVDDPHAWHDVDVAIVPGQLAVAENATVWVSHPDNRFRSIYFLTQKLVLVVPRDAMVDTMRDAYARIDWQSTALVPSFPARRAPRISNKAW